MADVTQAFSDTETNEPDEDYWVICLHEIAGCPAILRLVSGVPEAIGAESYEDRVAILWRYEAEPDGLPKDADSARMDFFEDVLVETAEERMNACLAIVATAKGTKEWTLYTDGGERVAEYVVQLARRNDLPVEVRCDKDPDWGTYHQLMAKAQDE